MDLAEPDARERVRQRLLARIHPNVIDTQARESAFEAAVDCQLAWEADNGDAMEAARRGVQRFSAGDYSETYFESRAAGDYGEICPDARAILFNAGLLERELPCARRI